MSLACLYFNCTPMLNCLSSQTVLYMRNLDVEVQKKYLENQTKSVGQMNGTITAHAGNIASCFGIEILLPEKQNFFLNVR